MALSWDKEMFDKNHDGKLTGSENTNWEIFWFGLGLGFGDKEDDEIYIAPKLIPDKKAAEIIRIIDKAYDQFLTNAKAILPQWDTAKQKLADRTFYHWITKGLANGVCLGYKKPGNINDPICKAYHLIVNVLFDEFIAVMISAMLWQKVYNYRDTNIPLVIGRK